MSGFEVVAVGNISTYFEYDKDKEHNHVQKKNLREEFKKIVRKFQIEEIGSYFLMHMLRLLANLSSS